MGWFSKKNDKVPQTVMVSDANFDAEVRQSALPVVIDFWAPWCGPCKVLGPVFDELSADFAGRAKLVKVNIDQNPRLVQQFKIKSIPTLAFVKDGRLIELLSGLVSQPNLAEMVEDLIAFEVVKDQEE